jgi:hypothetical protein
VRTTASASTAAVLSSSLALVDAPFVSMLA